MVLSSSVILWGNSKALTAATLSSVVLSPNLVILWLSDYIEGYRKWHFSMLSITSKDCNRESTLLRS
jgi:hypothetical protein